MAHVSLAKQEGIGNFEKLVVVKQIEPRRRHDEELVRMFLAEARLAARLRHPNIVEIYDVGVESGEYFIAMEYLSGENIRIISQTLSDRGETVPPAIASRIVASIAAGLHHAHTCTDASGDPRPVIHRDVTPSNLIVCYNGAVKLVDFGIAKALHDSDGDEEDATQAGVIKGKLSYLAPEQLQHSPADERTDVFQLGIVLHEMLTGQRLFGGASARQKISAVNSRLIPAPSSVNPEVPAVLDVITMSALERDPDARLQSADELRQGLEDVLASMGSYISDHDVAVWMRESFAGLHRQRQRLEQSVTAGTASDVRTSDPSSKEHSSPIGGDDDETVSLASAVTPCRIQPARRAGVRVRSRKVASGKGAFEGKQSTPRSASAAVRAMSGATRPCPGPSPSPDRWSALRSGQAAGESVWRSNRDARPIAAWPTRAMHRATGAAGSDGHTRWLSRRGSPRWPCWSPGITTAHPSGATRSGRRSGPRAVFWAIWRTWSRRPGHRARPSIPISKNLSTGRVKTTGGSGWAFREPRRRSSRPRRPGQPKTTHIRSL